jgi:hypothetical protein
MIQLRRKVSAIPVAFYFAALVLQGATAHAQTYDRTIISGGDSISHHYSYLFPSFKEAMVKFRDGRYFSYKMNFNTLLCDMQFINTKGDTLAITNGELIDSIQLDSSYFIFDYQKGYFQIVAVSDAARLAIYRRSTFEPVQKGGMGESKQSGGVEMINAMNTRQGARPLVLNQDIYAVRKTTYYLIFNRGDMETAGKAAFMKLYGGDVKSFDQYIRSNKINYNDQGDLERLFHFCTQSKM